MTVLFCDLADSTAAADGVDPEDVSERLHTYHARVRAEIERYGGTVEKFIGDAVAGFFGAPTSHEDDAERAVRAALRLVEAIDELNEAIPGLGLVVRIGVNTGEAVVALEARPESGEAFVIGDVVNTASRLERAAPRGGVLVGEGTYLATKHRFDYEVLPPARLRGKARPVPVFRAIAPLSRLGVDSTGAPPTAFVGREVELDLLRATFMRAVRGSGIQLVAIAGEPGIGKSRLVQEFFRFVDEPSDLPVVKWRRGRCLPYGDGIAFWALGEIVKSEAGIFVSDDAGTVAEKLERSLPEGPDRDWVRQRMLPLLGTGSESTAEREESFAAWRRYLEHLTATGPAVLVFEDLHWADDALLAFLEDLLDHAELVPMIVVATARPELFEHQPSWASAARNAMRINLGPLTEGETDVLVSSLLDEVGPYPEMKPLIARLSGGNPLYAEEYVRLLRDRGELTSEGGAAGGAVLLPANISALIAARLDTLSTERKQLLADAAVIGEVFWSGALAYLEGKDRAWVEDALHELSRRELVRRTRTSSMKDETEYRFWHALVRDVAYAQIPRAVRARRHLAVASWVEEVAPGRLEDLAEILASHYAEALTLLRVTHDPEAVSVERPALRYLLLAGEHTMSLNVERAEEHYLRAAELAPEGTPQRAEVLARLAQLAQVARADLSDSARLYDEAIAAFEELGMTERVEELRMQMAVVVDNQGDRDRSLTLIDEAIRRLEAEGPSPALARAYAERAFPTWGPSLEEAIVWADRALSLADRLRLPDVRATALGFRGASRVNMGDAGGLDDQREAIALSLETGLTSKTYANYANLVISLSYESPAEALRLAEEGLLFVRSRGLTEGETMIRAVRLEAMFHAGRWDALLTEADDLLPTLEEQGDRWGLAAVSFPKAWVLSSRGRSSEAVALFDSLGVGEHETEVDIDFAGVRIRALREAGALEGANSLLERVIDERERAKMPLREACGDISREAVALGRRDLLARCAGLCEGELALIRNGHRTIEALLAEMDGKHTKAAKSFDIAAEAWQAFGDPFESAEALLGRGRSQAALGRAGAQASLLQARDLFEDLGATPSVSAVDAALHRIGP